MTTPVGPRVPLSVAHWAGSPASGWPLHTFLELAALDGAVPSARLHARHVLREWSMAALGDDAELVVSELVTNGVQASRAMTYAAIRLWLASDQTHVVICIWDASPDPPVRVDAAGEAEHGRGLLLVEAVSKQWGWFPAEPGSPQAGGRVVGSPRAGGRVVGSPRAGGDHGKVVWAVIS